MAAKTAVKILTEFFNVNTVTPDTDPVLFAHNGEGETNPDTGAGVIGIQGKQNVTGWGAELKKFTAPEKRELAEMVCAITGDELIAPKSA